MKKIKLIAPLLSVASVASIAAPILTSCANKPSSDELKVTINGKESFTDEHITITHGIAKKNAPFAINFKTADTWKVEESSFVIKVGNDKILTSADYDVVITESQKQITIKESAMTDNINITINPVQESITAPIIDTQYAFYDYDSKKYYVNIDGFSCKNVDIESDLVVEVKSSAGFVAKAIKKTNEAFTLKLEANTEIFDPNGYDLDINFKTVHSQSLASQKNLKFWIMPATQNPIGYTQITYTGQETKTLDTIDFVTAKNKDGSVLDLNTVMSWDLEYSSMILGYTGSEWFNAVSIKSIAFVPSVENYSKLSLTFFQSYAFQRGYYYKLVGKFKTSAAYGAQSFDYTMYWACV